MRSLKKIEQEYSPEEIAESFVFPGSKEPKKKEALLKGFVSTGEKFRESNQIKQS